MSQRDDDFDFDDFLMGTSKNLLLGKFSMTLFICCVNKPCNTSSITAVCCLAAEQSHIRKFASNTKYCLVSVFREPQKNKDNTIRCMDFRGLYGGFF